jgi:hypothetical protein
MEMDCDRTGVDDNSDVVGSAIENLLDREIRLSVLEYEDGMTWLLRSRSRDGGNEDEADACGNIRRREDGGYRVRSWGACWIAGISGST